MLPGVGHRVDLLGVELVKPPLHDVDISRVSQFAQVRIRPGQSRRQEHRPDRVAAAGNLKAELIDARLEQPGDFQPKGAEIGIGLRLEFAQTDVVEPDVGLSPALVVHVENQIDILPGVLRQPVAGVEGCPPERRPGREHEHLFRGRHRHRRPARGVSRRATGSRPACGFLPEPGVANRKASGVQVAEELVRVGRRHFAPVLEVPRVTVPSPAQIRQAQPRDFPQPSPKALHAPGRIAEVPLNTLGEVRLPGVIAAIQLPAAQQGAVLMYAATMSRRNPRLVCRRLLVC